MLKQAPSETNEHAGPYSSNERRHQRIRIPQFVQLPCSGEPNPSRFIRCIMHGVTRCMHARARVCLRASHSPQLYLDLSCQGVKVSRRGIFTHSSLIGDGGGGYLGIGIGKQWKARVRSIAGKVPPRLTLNCLMTAASILSPSPPIDPELLFGQ